METHLFSWSLKAASQQGGLLGCASPPRACATGSRQGSAAGDGGQGAGPSHDAGAGSAPPPSRGVLPVLANKENQLRYMEMCRAQEGKSVCILARGEISLSVKWPGRSW